MSLTAKAQENIQKALELIEKESKLQKEMKEIMLSIFKKDDDYSIQAPIIKTNDEKRLVYAWASVIKENGQMVVDHQGDIIDEGDLTKAVHRFMLESRMSKEMHKGSETGDVVESMMFSEDLQRALGINLNKVGWMVAIKIKDDDVWKRIKKGELKMLSIGGHGKREDL